MNPGYLPTLCNTALRIATKTCLTLTLLFVVIWVLLLLVRGRSKHIYIFHWPVVIDIYFMFHKSTNSLEGCKRKCAIEDTI